jgi:hypothetical protein
MQQHGLVSGGEYVVKMWRIWMENMETSGKMMGNGKENGWNMQENG